MSFQYVEENNRFTAKDSQGIEAGEVTFSRGGEGVLVIDHTGVDPDYRGQGVAEELVRKVVEKAKKEGLKVQPVCSYAKREFEKHEDYREVLQQ
jgi:uncharacterized protein